MCATSLTTARATRRSQSQDPMASLLVKQRPEVIGGPVRELTAHAVERISDPAAIAALLTSCTKLTDDSEDDLVFELLYLETLLACQPVRSRVLLEQLGELGEEVRDGLLPPGVINFVALRRRTRRLRQNMGVLAGRITAAMLVFFTSVPLLSQAARAEDHTQPHDAVQNTATPVIRVVDAKSGQGVAGVQIRSMEEQLLGVTDANGQATLSDGYQDTDLLSLEKQGYQMYLLDRSQLASRNLVSMKPLQDAVHMANANGDTHAQVAVKPLTPPGQPTAPKVVAQAGHAPHVVPPRPPVRPKGPEVRIALPPRNTRQAPAKPVEMAAKPETKPQLPVIHDAPHDSVLPAQVDHPVSTATTPRHAIANHPASARRPLVAKAAPKAAPKEAPSVAVPQHMPARQGAKDDAHGAWNTYRIKPGDTLSELAYRLLGSASRWPELYAANRDSIRNPHWILAGHMLLIPQHDSGVAMAKAKAPAATRHYVVRPGDSLYTIAGHQLGSALAWHQIFELNRSHIPNPRYIYPGQSLVLPG